MATEFEGAKGADAFRYPADQFHRVDMSTARSCRWVAHKEDPADWRAFQENIVLLGQLQPVIMSKVPPLKEPRLLVGSRRFLAIKEINEKLPEWQEWLDTKIQETQDRLTLDTGMSEALKEELQGLKKVYEDARKRIAAPMPLLFVNRPVRSAEEADRIALAENEHRLSMSPMDKANFARVKKLRLETNREIAEAMALPSATHVKWLLSYFDLPEDAQELLHQGHLTEALARRMRTFDSETTQKICSEARKGTKPAELMKMATSLARTDGEQISQSMSEHRKELHDLWTDETAPTLAREIAGWVYQRLKGNPSAPSLRVIFEAEQELPELPKPEVKPVKEPKPPKTPKTPKAAKPKKEPKSKPEKAAKPLSKSAQKKKAAAERKEEAKRKAEEEAEELREELEAQEPVAPEDLDNVQVEPEDEDYRQAVYDDDPTIQAAMRIHDQEKWNC